MAAVVFNEAEHSYTVAGVRWPSVTQVLDPLLELDGIPRAALEAAAHFGNHVHIATHLWDLGRLDEDDLDPPLRPYLEAWKALLRDTGAVVLNTERRVAHSKLCYAGTLDKVVQLESLRHLLDIKTSAEVPWTVGMQTAAYRQALIEEEKAAPAGRPTLSAVRFCAHLKGDGTYRLHTLKDGTDFNSFVSVLNVHYLRLRYGRKPR